jgi:hypothetical protein
MHTLIASNVVCCAINLKTYRWLFILIVELLFLGTIQAQDIEQITKAKWFTISGGAGAN